LNSSIVPQFPPNRNLRPEKQFFQTVDKTHTLLYNYFACTRPAPEAPAAPPALFAGIFGHFAEKQCFHKENGENGYGTA